MKLTVFARPELLAAVGGVPASTLLLEGSWPALSTTGDQAALDELIDGHFEWIDREACRLAETLDCLVGEWRDETPIAGLLVSPLRLPAPAYINALALRYYLVKLIRVVAYFGQIRRLGPDDHLELFVAHGRDEDYAELFVQIARAAGADLSIRWQEPDPCAVPPAPPNPAWRRCAGSLASLIEPRRSAVASRRRIVLCGNARFLDPVCGELLSRGCQVWWLYDRFSPRAWLRWRAWGVGQLVCNSSLACDARLAHDNRIQTGIPDRLICRGINLAPSVHIWLGRRLRAEGPRQTRVACEIDAHFRRVLPHVLLVDEDATPFARSAVALAREHQAASLVVQHGIPVCRFGFAPLSADRFLAWGRTSKRQLIDWDVPPEQILVTGSPHHDRWLGKRPRRRFRRAGGCQRGTVPFLRRPATKIGAVPRRILLLATTPPNDARPDAAALHFNRSTYAEMLRMAFAAVAKLGDAELMIRPHPRSLHDPMLRKTMAAFPSVPCRMAARGPLKKWLARADCVLACMSSSGVEAALVGVPTIGLLPSGSGRLLPHDQWGMTANARTEAELDRALAAVLTADPPLSIVPQPEVFANLTGSAVARVAQAVLTAASPRQRTPLPQAIVRRTAAEPCTAEPAIAPSGRVPRPMALERFRAARQVAGEGPDFGDHESATGADWPAMVGEHETVAFGETAPHAQQ